MEEKEKVIEKIESLGWNVYQHDNQLEIENYSPAGEDLIFNIDNENIVESVNELANEFSIDDHILLWVDHLGESGTPSTIKELLEDAEEIKEMLNELANALNK